MELGACRTLSFNIQISIAEPASKCGGGVKRLEKKLQGTGESKDTGVPQSLFIEWWLRE